MWPSLEVCLQHFRACDHVELAMCTLQAVLAPARLLWYVLGDKAYVAAYNALDSFTGGLAAFGTEHGGLIASVGTAALVLPLGLMSSRVISTMVVRALKHDSR